MLLAGLEYAEVVGQTAQIIGSLLWSALVAGVVLLIHHSILYSLSGNTVRKDSGILNRKREEMHVRKVQSVDVQQNLIERFILRTGSVYFCSATTDVQRDDIIFLGISDPHRVADLARAAELGEYSGSEAYRRLREDPAPSRQDYEEANTHESFEAGPPPVYRPGGGLPPR